MAVLTRPAYSTVVENVREVSLHGGADLAYWRAYLRREQLAPLEQAGQAQVLVIAAEMVWLGARFTELSVSVAVAGRGAAQHGGMYLIEAFNSRRSFAWAERTFFQTPYRRALARVSVEPPIGFALGDSHTPALSGSLASAPPRAAAVPETLAGPVYLPGRLTGSARSEKVFYAELSGATEIYPFAAADQWRCV